MGFLRLGLASLLLSSAVDAQTTLVLKSGQQYDLNGPAKVRNGVVTFKTTDGRFLSIRQSDILRETETPAAEGRKPLSSSDSRELGEIARQGRQEKGVSAPVDPRPRPAPPPADKDRKGAKKGPGRKSPAKPKSKTPETSSSPDPKGD